MLRQLFDDRCFLCWRQPRRPDLAPDRFPPLAHNRPRHLDLCGDHIYGFDTAPRKAVAATAHEGAARAGGCSAPPRVRAWRVRVRTAARARWRPETPCAVTTFLCR